MIDLLDKGVYLVNGAPISAEEAAPMLVQRGMSAEPAEGRRRTISYKILQAHNTSGDESSLKLKFNAMASHDLTFVGIIQTARASGMTSFPLPYVLTCCHNSLCAVGGTINADDQIFGLSAAKKYGGIFVPPHVSVIHQFMREEYAGCGDMILASDSHTRYGALGCMGIGEGGGELDKQILGGTWDSPYPPVVAIYLTGVPAPWVGPHDVAIALCGAVFKNGFVKNKVLEFIGPGVKSLGIDFRNGIDIMTTETGCLSSIWQTDEETRRFLETHRRGSAFKELSPEDGAYYDGCAVIDLSKIKPMIAIPFHPSNAVTIDDFNANLEDYARDIEAAAKNVSQGRAPYSVVNKIEQGRFRVTQGSIVGCAGGLYTNIAETANLLRGKSIGAGGFALSVYPSSMPIYLDLSRKGILGDLMSAGVNIRSSICGPCFGSGDTPWHNGFSLRHATRNFPNREGAKPGQGQMAFVGLMDARSIAATALNGGLITSAEEYGDAFGNVPEYSFDDSPYVSRVFNGFGKPDLESELVLGPNIKDWPEMEPLADNILLELCSKIMDEVTTTDELIPSGETASFRSNPIGLAEFTLSRRDPAYVGRAKAAATLEAERLAGKAESSPALSEALEQIRAIPGFKSVSAEDIEIGSVIYARKPGDGSAREQAASCQRVLGGLANICREYATKRYRSNIINWGMIPFRMETEPDGMEPGDRIFIPGIRDIIESGSMSSIKAYVLGKSGCRQIELCIDPLGDEEKKIILAGSLINFNRG
ncbi:MAG: hydratase [Firmicutes bacterium]|nr:hydratase [Bacillota bacterium]